MSGTEKIDNNKQQKLQEEDADDSSDEDYVPGKQDDEDVDDKDEQDEIETKKEIKNANYSAIENSEGGLVKTRRQRLTEAQQQNDNKYKELLNETTEASVDINSIWSDMNQVKEKVIKPVIVAAPKTEAGGKTIKIKRQYEYAGETVVEDKWVLETSAEAKAYLNSLKIEKDEEAAEPEKVAKPAVRQGPVRKRKKSSIVDNIIKGSKLAKISTLEKSRLDWANYVDSNKLNDELVHHNKDGYLNKQDFLHKVEANIDRKFKEGTNGV